MTASKQPHTKRCIADPDERIINIDKFCKKLTGYVNDGFAFSDWEKKETIEEVTDLVISCCASHSSQPVPDDSEQFIITGFQLKQLQDHADLDFVCQAIRHHPILEDWTRVLNDAWMQERDERIKAEAAKAERERLLESIHKRTLQMRHRASSEEVNAEAVILDYSAVYELLQSLRGGEP